MAVTADYLSSIKVMPVVVLDSVEDALPVAQALLKGGIKAIEVTLRTPAALDCLKVIKSDCPDLLLGVGTVVNTGQIEQIAKIGVDFAVSPGMTKTLVECANQNDLDLLPGVATCSEVMTGLDMGLKCFKLFPAVAVGGYGLLKSIAGPLPQATFCPTGGLTIENFVDYLKLPNVACVGGSWLVPQSAVKEKNWTAIEDISAKTMAALSA